MNEDNDDLSEVWSRYILIAREYKQLRRTLRRLSDQRREETLRLVRRSLARPDEKDVALEFVPALAREDQQELFEALLPRASELDIGVINRAAKIILSFPRDFVVTKLEQSLPFFLEDVERITAEVMELYFEADKSLARRLAERAATSDDEDRRDLGHFCLQRLASVEDPLID